MPNRAGPTIKQFVLSYSPDWVIAIALWIVAQSIDKNFQGFKRQFSLSDISLRYPYASPQRVGSNALHFLSYVVPLISQAIINLVTMRSWWDLHHSTLGLVLSHSLTSVITQTVKVTVGRPRPDLIARCRPMEGAEDPAFGLSSVAICTQTKTDMLNDGFRSFPSGHSSMAFAGLGFLALYLAGKLHLFDTRGHLGKIWLVFIPLAGASYVALSRTMDYRHHWQDILVGSLLGFSMAYFAYRQYYPSLTSFAAHRPYATRFKNQFQVEDQDARLPVNREVFIERYEDEEDGIDAGLLNGQRKPSTTAAENV